MTIFKNNIIDVQIEQSEIPWLKIFTVEPYKEFSQCDQETKNQILSALDLIEKLMLDYFKPDKINIASFGNYMPHVHFHIMARFKDDSYFPEPMWGKMQREANLELPDFKEFYDLVNKKLST